MAFEDIPTDVRRQMMASFEIVMIYGDYFQRRMARRLLLDLIPRGRKGAGYSFIVPLENEKDLQLAKDNAIAKCRENMKTFDDADAEFEMVYSAKRDKLIRQRKQREIED